MKNEEHLFPLYHNGKPYYEDDCADLFLAFYHDADCLRMGAVYAFDGMWVYPDGTVDYE